MLSGEQKLMSGEGSPRMLVHWLFHCFFRTSGGRRRRLSHAMGTAGLAVLRMIIATTLMTKDAAEVVVASLEAISFTLHAMGTAGLAVLRMIIATTLMTKDAAEVVVA